MIKAVIYYTQHQDIIIAGNIHLKKDFFYYAKHNKDIFIIIYDLENKHMPLAVLQQPYTVKINSFTKKNGYNRYFYLTMDNIQFMNQAKKQSFIKDYSLGNVSKLIIKVRIDRDGFGGKDSSGDLISEKIMVDLSKENISIPITTLVSE